MKRLKTELSYAFCTMLVTCIFCSDLNAQTENGTIHKVPNWTWVNYENKGIRQPWSNTTTYSKIGDSCGISKDGLIKVIGQFNEELVLCLYKTQKEGLGTACENGTIFLLPKSELLNYNSLSKLKTKEETEKKEKIQELIKNIVTNGLAMHRKA